MITPIVTSLLATFKEPLLKASKDLKDEFLHLYDNGLTEYINNFYNKYSKTKTFIYRDEKVDFYDIYYPVHLKQSFYDQITPVTDLKKLFRQRNFLTIIGSAGSGKSMLMKHIFLSCVSQTLRIPIVVELRNLNDYDGNVNDYIFNIISRNKLAHSNKLIERILDQGKFLFLFDGYDEIYSSNKDKITNELEEFVDTYSKNTYVVTSRPGSNAESLQRFDNFYVQNLNQTQIKEFVHIQFKNHENKESIEKILAIIDLNENNDYEDYLTNPLLLSMFIFTFNSYPELPKYKNKFYWNVFDTLCTKHDAFTKKGFWLHERKSKLSNDDFESILKWLSYITIFKGKYNFDYQYLKNLLKEIKSKLNLNCDIDDLIYDLNVSISILIQDGTEYTFPHKSLQEYFTALLIRGLHEEQKQKIYTEKFKELEEFTNGGNLNLFKLCYELDKSLFSRYFLIPNLESFLSRIDNHDDYTFTQSCLKAFKIEFYFHPSNKEIGGYSEKSKSTEQYLPFFNLPSSLPPFEKMNASVFLIADFIDTQITISNEFNDISNEKKDSIWHEALNNFFIESGIFKNFKLISNELMLKLNNLKEELKNENLTTKELLDI